MEWNHYIAAFFAGAFLANMVPHFVHGISGNRFPTPFSKPRGIGLSPATTNMAWALVNLLVGGWLFIKGDIGMAHPLSLFVCFVGIAAMGLVLSARFTRKHKE